MELYNERHQKNSKLATIRLFLDVLFLFRPGIIRNVNSKVNLNNSAMLRNFIITTLRFALRHKGYTSLNLIGLSVGISAVMIILLWINDEISMDTFHTNSHRTVKLWRNMHQTNGEIITTSAIPQPLEILLEEEYPEIDQVALIGWEMELAFRKGESVSYETGRYVSPEFFSIFSFPILLGNKGDLFSDMNSIVITERLATKYFGASWREEAIGNTINVNERQLVVSGVMEIPGPNSSVDFDWLTPAQEYMNRNSWVESWYNGGFSMVLTLRDMSDFDAVQERIEQEVNKHTNYEADERIFMQRFPDVYLNSNFENGIPSGGRIEYVRILFIVAIFIMLIACINFMNLATARSNRRAREIGIRKVMGARKGGIRTQFFTESFMTSGLSVMVGVLIVLIVLPYFNQLTGKYLTLDFASPLLWGLIISIIVISGVLSGSYPALLLASFGITDSMKGVVGNKMGGGIIRKALVIFQFSLSILLIIGTAVVYQQMSFVLNMSLGLDRENVLYVEMQRDLVSDLDVYKNELASIPEVTAVTAASGNPLSYGRSTGSAEWPGKDPNANVEINVLNVDLDFLTTMKGEIIQGRDFSSEILTDTANYIINEVTAEILGFQDPIGQDFSIWGLEGKIIGVVRNFHMDSMFEPIDPLVIRLDPNSTFLALIRIRQDITKVLPQVEKITTGLSPAYPFKYGFLDDEYTRSYQSEMVLGSLAMIFSLISILISCLGLLGLSSYSTTQRAREIGIRKVHGANVAQLVMMLSKDYAKLMLVSFVIGAPIAHLVMKEWLNSFAFRTEINFLVYFLIGIAVFVGGALTVSLKSYQAATISPTHTLKDE